MNNLALLIEEEMRRKGLSTRDVGAEVGVAHTTIARILKGKPVNVNTLGRVAQFLQADPADFISTSDEEGDLTRSIAAIVRQEPALAEVLQKAADKVQNGGMPPEVLREIVRYAAWRINDVSSNAEASAPSAEKDKKGEATASATNGR